LRYVIPFASYGARLRGGEPRSVDRRVNLIGSPLLEPDAERVKAARRAMLQDPCVLDATARPVVLAAIRRHCIRHALQYGIDEQGQPMELFIAGEI
jgi:hypothetical protein